jgi:type II secretory pathway component GspD/PulD (secretin)
MRKKDTEQRVNKVPLLSDLPLLGNFFKFEGGRMVISELVVFITPRIIIEPALTEDEQKAYGVTEVSRPDPVFTRAETEAAEK